MTKLSWNEAGKRFYEAGVDKAVLYPNSGAGVAWNGLVSVLEKPSGGEAAPYYLDGVRYVNVPTREEFTATLEAYTYPDEFAYCDGTKKHSRGLVITQQERSMFDLCYRTGVGNDTDGLEYDYKLHLVYNAIASPSERSNKSITESLDPLLFAWNITTTPVNIPGFHPSAHFVVEAKEAGLFIMPLLEDIVYGTAAVNARLPRPTEILSLFNDWTTVHVTYNGNGVFTASGLGDIVRLTSATTFEMTSETITMTAPNAYAVPAIDKSNSAN